MKRMRVNKYLKRGLITGALLLSAAGIGLVFKEYKSEHIKEEKKTVYNYQLKSDVNYIVHVKPNILYEGKELGEGQMYLTEFVDYIEANFTSGFTGSEKADIEGNYGIKAEVRGFTTKDEQKQIIWTKVFELEKDKTFKETSDKQTINDKIKINFLKYNKFAQDVLEASKVNSDVELVVKLTGKKSIQAVGQPLNDEMQTTLTIPLNNGYFGITKEGSSDKSDVLTETIKVPVPINKQWIKVCGGVSGAGVIAAVLMLIFLAPLNAQDIKRKKIKKIFNQHGSRMVMVDRVRAAINQEVYQLSNIEDLIKIADEIEKPVLYEAKQDMIDRTHFYVKEQETLYVYEVKEESPIDLAETKERTKKIKKKKAPKAEQNMLKEEVAEANSEAAKSNLGEISKKDS